MTYYSNLTRFTQKVLMDEGPLDSVRTKYDDVVKIVDERFYTPSVVSASGNIPPGKSLYDNEAELDTGFLADVRKPGLDIVEIHSKVKSMEKTLSSYIQQEQLAAQQKKASESPVAASESTSSVSPASE